MSNNDFRDNLIPYDSPRLVNARGQDPFEYAKPIIATPKAQSLIQEWQSLYAQPFKGITSNGVIEKGLFRLGDEGLDIYTVSRAGKALLAGLSDGERGKVRYSIDAPEWRDWYNPEFPMNAHGLRLDYASSRARELVIDLLRVSLGYLGYVKTNRCRSANLYLGELYDLRNIMNEWSYHFLLFGTPSETEPWGWSFYGHHLALNCFILGGQMVISPTFMGAEPTIIDRGPHDSFRLFEREENGGLKLMRSLTPAMRERAVIYKTMKDSAMPEGRWHFADERQVGAAYRDNRVIPYEGVSAAEFSSAQQEQVLKIVDAFIEYLPDGPRAARLHQLQSVLERTHFCWIGDYGDEDPFYYRVQSPVIMVEFDHHCGVWLTNPEPAKYHIHTVVRTPNGNDYGKDLLRQHYEQSHQKGSAHAQQGSDPDSHRGEHNPKDDKRHSHAHSHPHQHGDEHNHTGIRMANC
jgi:hypothetical protein